MSKGRCSRQAGVQRAGAGAGHLHTGGGQHAMSRAADANTASKQQAVTALTQICSCWQYEQVCRLFQLRFFKTVGSISSTWHKHRDDSFCRLASVTMPGVHFSSCCIYCC